MTMVLLALVLLVGGTVVAFTTGNRALGMVLGMALGTVSATVAVFVALLFALVNVGAVSLFDPTPDPGWVEPVLWLVPGAVFAAGMVLTARMVSWTWGVRHHTAPSS